MKLFKLTKSLVLRLFSTCLPTQMMAAGNPNWWSMQQTSSDVQQPFLHLLNNQFSLHGGSSSSSSSSSSSTSSSSLPFSPLIADQSVPQDLPQSWSQLLLNGMGSNNEEERMGPSNHFHQIHHVISPSSPPPPSPLSSNHLHESIFAINHQQQQQQQQQQQNLIKQETSLFDPRSGLYGHGNNIYSQQRPVSWSQISPKSSITTLSNNNDNNNNNNNFMNFSTNCYKGREKNHLVEQSSECKSPSIATGVAKKPRVQAASTPPLKVRKEKLGDRITALHQIVSPFGKTDTASVLLEAIGYIRFLQGQVEALCSPYLGSVSGINQHSAHGERNGLFPDHPGQLLNDSCMKRRGAANHKDGCAKDLRSRGLCLVPTSCTQLVANDQNTTDYWAPSLGPPGF